MLVLFQQKKLLVKFNKRQEEYLPLSESNHLFGRSGDLSFYKNMDQFVAVDNDVIAFKVKSDLKIV